MNTLENQIVSRDTPLHVVTPISGNLADLSKLETTRLAATNYPISFIYVVDTDSEQDFERICSSISPGDHARVEIIRINVKSPGLARNAALQRIESGWICFWDADDLPQVREFYEMVCTAEKNSNTICLGGFQTINSKGIIKGHFPLSKTKKKTLIHVGMNPGLWRFGFQRELIGKTRFKEYKMAEDQLFLAEIEFSLDNLFNYTNSVYRYTIDEPGQLTRDAEAVKDLLKTYKEMYARLGLRSSPLRATRTLMFTRQLLTGMKRLPVKDKFKVIRFTLFILLRSQGLRIQLLKSLFIIIRTKKGQPDVS
jgi:glycosyltransferase involved in cell wall biosynthesis